MAFQFMSQIKCINNFTGDRKPTIIAEYVCDTQSDLPARSQSTYYVGIGSTAIVVEDSSKWRIKSDGAWVMYEQGTATYTKSEIDALLSLKANKATTLAGYGITNAYTKAQTNTEIQNAVSDKIAIGDVFGIGAIIQENSDLNDYTAIGVYTCPSVTIANTLVNSPISGIAFRMEVSYLNNQNRYRQCIYPLSNNTYYARIYTSSGWQAWYKFEGVQV